jgi:uncharacterized protein (TIGR03437 family)
MLRIGCIFALCCSSLLVAQNNQDVSVASLADASVGLAPESLGAATGTNLAAQTATAQTLPWPTTLGGVTVQVSDSAGVARPAGLFLVSPKQINFQVPAGTAAGAATVTINNGGTPVSVPLQIQPVAPGLLRMNDLGVPAATAVRVVIPTTMQSPVPIFQCVDTPGSCRLVPIGLGVDTPIYLSFYGTGIRGRSSLDNVKVTIGSVDVTALYAGPQNQFPGLDQVNVPLPLSLRGAGEVNVTVTVDGVTSNPVKINVQ